MGICLGTDGKAYVTGYTSSPNFPTKNPYQAELGGFINAFVTAFSSTGSTLLYSTYLGGSIGDYGMGICLGKDGKAYLTGITDSFDFPTVNPYQAGSDVINNAFVAALCSTGSALFYSTYLGGSGSEHRPGICLGTDGKAYITGYTNSSDFPTVNPYQAEHGGGSVDAFVTTLSSSGSTLLYSTYLGGSQWDSGNAICLGTDGRAYVTGWTDSSDFPTVNPYQAELEGGSWDVFVLTLSSSGSTLLYSTYLGGSRGDSGNAICLGTDGKAYITGYTDSSDFPTKNSYQAEYGGGNWDIFVCALSSTGSALSYSTYLGGSGKEVGNAIVLGTGDSAYITGYTASSNFPTENPYQPIYQGGDFDAFVSKLTLLLPLPWINDYNGDGKSDIAIFQPISGLWAIRDMTRIYFGSSIDEPIPRDYNGDGTTDIGIFRQGSGLWAIRGVSRVYFGSSSDIPQPGDYDGDGCCDVGIFRYNSGLWAIRGVTRVYFGGSTDEPVPGYYNEDGTMDIGIFRPGSGLWAIRMISRIYFGGSLDDVIPGDYDRDGIWDAGIYRPSSGLWAIRGVTRVYFGSSADFPVPADYDGSGMDSIGIFREKSGLWAVRGITRAYFGGSSDIPVTR